MKDSYLRNDWTFQTRFRITCKNLDCSLYFYIFNFSLEPEFLQNKRSYSGDNNNDNSNNNNRNMITFKDGKRPLLAEGI